MLRRKKFLLATILLFFFLWILGPQLAVWSIALASKKGEESSQSACDRIVFFGERAIQPTIASIERNSPWTRRYCYLPSVLAKIGGSAHDDLLDAIEEQKDPRKRAYLISALQTAFSYYSKLTLIIDDYEAERLTKRPFIFMQTDIRYAYEDAPELLTEEQKLNPAFKAYWADVEKKSHWK